MLNRLIIVTLPLIVIGTIRASTTYAYTLFDPEATLYDSEWSHYN